MSTQENQNRLDAADTLDPRQVHAIDLLVQGLNMEETAQQVGVSSRTIRRWKQEAEFAGELRFAIGEVCDHVRLKINPLILRAEDQANRGFKITDELMDSTDYRLVSKACNFASTNAIKWIKLLMALDKAETMQNFGNVAKALNQIGGNDARASVPQASSLPVTTAALEGEAKPEPARGMAPLAHVERQDGMERNAECTVDAASRPDSDRDVQHGRDAHATERESGQNRTSENPVASAQTQPAKYIKPSEPAPKPMSAPVVPQASSLPVPQASGRRDAGGRAPQPSSPSAVHPVIAEAAAAVVSRKFGHAGLSPSSDSVSAPNRV